MFGAFKMILLHPAASTQSAGSSRPLLSKAFTGYSQRRCGARKAHCRAPASPDRGNPRPVRLLRESTSSNCTNSGHPPVNQLHSVENKSDKLQHFSLTPKIEGVQQD